LYIRRKKETNKGKERKMKEENYERNK